MADFFIFVLPFFLVLSLIAALAGLFIGFMLWVIGAFMDSYWFENASIVATYAGLTFAMMFGGFLFAELAFYLFNLVMVT